MTTVSVLCVTFNRQHLIPFIIYQFKKQSYPNHLMELIIYDDSKDRVFPNIHDDNINYIYSNEKTTLGAKRNKLNSIAKGDIIVWFDDDDYYFPDRIKDTVSLLNNSKQLLVGCTYTLLYDSFKTGRIFKINHKSNYTQNNILAYKKEYLQSHGYDDNDNCNEEKHFTNDFSEQPAMMDGKNLCIHIAHRYNTVSKSRVLVKKNLTKLSFESIVHDKYVLDTINNMNCSSYYDNIKTVDYNQHTSLNVHSFYSEFYNSQFSDMLKVYNHLKLLEKVIFDGNDSGYINCTYYGKKFIIISDKDFKINDELSNVKNIVTNAPHSWEILELCVNDITIDNNIDNKGWVYNDKELDLSLYAVNYDSIDKLLKKFKAYDHEKNCSDISFEYCNSHNIFDELNVYRLNTGNHKIKI